MAWTGPAQGSTLRNKNLHDGGGMRNQAAIDIPCYVHHQSSLKKQSISSTEIYPTSAILWHVQIQLLAENYHWLE